VSVAARPRLLLVALAAALLGGGILSACGGDDDGGAEAPEPVARPEDFPSARGKTLAQLRAEVGGTGPILARSVSQLEPGRNRFGFGMFDRARAQIADAPTVLYVAPVGGGPASGPFPARYESLKVDPRYESRTVAEDRNDPRSLYVANVDFERAGDYEMLGVVRLDNRLMVATPSWNVTRVARDSPVPEVGQRAPRVHTPTVQSAGGAIQKIETRVPPDSMHEVDFASVLGKKPVVLLFATPQLCQSRVCGPAVDIAEEVKAKLGGDADFVHMEVFRNNTVEDGYRPQMLAWNLPTEPWLFAVDRRGRIAARIEGAFSRRELERAVAAAERG
jgi:hypothetical protein